jgi:hypothetical protein
MCNSKKCVGNHQIQYVGIGSPIEATASALRPAVARRIFQLVTSHCDGISLTLLDALFLDSSKLSLGHCFPCALESLATGTL